MLMGLKKPLVQGADVHVTLNFAKAGAIAVTLPVGSLGATGPASRPPIRRRSAIERLMPASGAEVVFLALFRFRRLAPRADLATSTASVRASGGENRAMLPVPAAGAALCARRSRHRRRRAGRAARRRAGGVRRGLFARGRRPGHGEWRDRRGEPGRRRTGGMRAVRREGDGGVSARVWPLTPMPRLAGDYIFLREAGDGDYSALADRPAAAHRRRRAILRPVAVQDRRFALLGRDGADHPRQSRACSAIRPEQIVAIGARPTFIQRLVYPLPVASGAMRQIAARDRGAGVPACAVSLRSVRRRSGFMSAAQMADDAAILEALRPLGFTALDPARHEFRGAGSRFFAGGSDCRRLRPGTGQCRFRAARRAGAGVDARRAATRIFLPT